MIRKAGREIVAVRIGLSAKKAIRRGRVLLWQAVRSCFGSGAWVNDSPWMNDEGWIND